MNRPIKRRMLATFICIIFILISFLSILFVIEHTEHSCTGDDCQVCAQLQTAQNLLKQIAVAMVGASFSAVKLSLLWLFLKNANGHIVLLTPIALKVRMNN